jgi:hypothetical protein
VEATHGMANGSLRTDDADGYASASSPIFQYMERDPPFCREPLTDKVSFCLHPCLLQTFMHIAT